MRKMPTLQEIDYINKIQDHYSVTDNGSVYIDVKDGKTVLSSFNLVSADGNAELRADGAVYIDGYYSEDHGDYLYEISISEDGLALNELDPDSGDYVPRFLLNEKIKINSEVEIRSDNVLISDQDDLNFIELNLDDEDSIVIGAGAGLALGWETLLKLTGNLPTSDPHVVKAVWNDNGVLKISAGA